MKPSDTYNKCNQQAMAATGSLAPNMESLMNTATTTAASFLFPGATWLKATRGVLVGQLSRLFNKAVIYDGQFTSCMQANGVPVPDAPLP